MRSMREADRVIVLDTGSEDDTVARLRALGLYYSGRAAESIAPAERALALSPGDARLKENVRIIRQKVNKSVEKAL